MRLNKLSIRRVSHPLARGMELTALCLGAAVYVDPGAGAKAVAAEAPMRREIPATPQTYWDKIQSARPGDVILLGEGAYGVMNLNGKKFPEPGIRVQAARGAKAVFTRLGIQGSEGIEVRGVEVALDDNPFAVMVNGSTRIRLKSLAIHALGTGPSSAMMLRNSDHVSVVDCDVRQIGTGINFLDSDRLDITGNHFSDIEVDAIRGSGSNIDVENNTATSFHPKPGDHPDFIQFWGSKSHPTDGNIIKSNVYERGAGEVAQGVFIEDNQNITISGNVLVGSMYNAISLARVTTALIENNYIQGYADMGARIIVRGRSSDVVIRRNTAEAIVNYEREGPNPGYREERNTTIGPAKIGDTTAMKAWMVSHKPD